MVTNNFISINKGDHNSFLMKIYESAFVIQFDAITLLVIRFCHTIQDISDFVIKYFEVSLKYLWQKRICVKLDDKSGYLTDKVLLSRSLSSNHFLTKADICQIVWQNRISLTFYDKSGYLTDFSLDSDFSNIPRVHICRKRMLSMTLNVCNK